MPTAQHVLNTYLFNEWMIITHIQILAGKGHLIGIDVLVQIYVGRRWNWSQNSDLSPMRIGPISCNILLQITFSCPDASFPYKPMNSLKAGSTY